MEIKEFLQNFIDQFDDIDSKKITFNTKYREIDDWSSIIALSVLAMIDDEYDVQLNATEMRATETIEDLYKLVISKNN